LLGRDVDLVEGKALKTLAREEALRERVDAF
jgi:predicted nucleotidyltransferase